MDLTAFIRTNDNNLREGQLSTETYIRNLVDYLKSTENRENSRMLFGLRYLFITENNNYGNVALGLYRYPFDYANGGFIMIMEKKTTTAIPFLTPVQNSLDYKVLIKQTVLPFIVERYRIICMHEELNFLTNSMNVSDYYNLLPNIYRVLWPSTLHGTNDFYTTICNSWANHTANVVNGPNLEEEFLTFLQRYRNQGWDSFNILQNRVDQVVHPKEIYEDNDDSNEFFSKIKLT